METRKPPVHGPSPTGKAPPGPGPENDSPWRVLAGLVVIWLALFIVFMAHQMSDRMSGQEADPNPERGALVEPSARAALPDESFMQEISS